MPSFPIGRILVLPALIAGSVFNLGVAMADLRGSPLEAAGWETPRFNLLPWMRDVYWTIKKVAKRGTLLPIGPGERCLKVDYHTGVATLTPISSLTPCPEGYVRVVATADTHLNHRELTLPEGDLLIHAGDILRSSRRFSKRHGSKRMVDFLRWIESRPHPKIIFVGGNHDSHFETLGKEGVDKVLQRIAEQAHPDKPYDGDRISYCTGDDLEVEGLRIFASPLSYGDSGNSAFQSGTEEGIKQISEFPPHSRDIIITHDSYSNPTLRKALETARPKVHIGGHFHFLHGCHKLEGGVLSVTASLSSDRQRQPCQPPICIDLPKERAKPRTWPQADVAPPVNLD